MCARLSSEPMPFFAFAAVEPNILRVRATRGKVRVDYSGRRIVFLRTRKKNRSALN